MPCWPNCLTDEAIIAGLQEEVAVLTARVNASIPACGVLRIRRWNLGFYRLFRAAELQRRVRSGCAPVLIPSAAMKPICWMPWPRWTAPA